MKKYKVAGTSCVVTEMLLASGDAGLERMISLFNCILKEKRIPSKWDTSVIVNCLKHKGEATERGNYRGLKLLGHTLKIFERIIKKEIRKVIDVSEMQFGFMSGAGTIDAIFIARQLRENTLEKGIPLFRRFRKSIQ